MKTSKQIKLSSGATCVIRPLSQRDLIANGAAPLFIQFAKMAKRRAPSSEDIDETKAIEAMVHLAEIKLTNCCGPITYPDGTRLAIVKKPFHECASNEVTIDDLAQQDANEIVAAIDELSGLTKEAVEAAATFLQQSGGQANGDCAASPGGELPQTAVGTPEPKSV